MSIPLTGLVLAGLLFAASNPMNTPFTSSTEDGVRKEMIQLKDSLKPEDFTQLEEALGVLLLTDTSKRSRDNFFAALKGQSPNKLLAKAKEQKIINLESSID